MATAKCCSKERLERQSPGVKQQRNDGGRKKKDKQKLLRTLYSTVRQSGHYTVSVIRTRELSILKRYPVVPLNC